jgi:hypothetical protein
MLAKLYPKSYHIGVPAINHAGLPYKEQSAALCSVSWNEESQVEEVKLILNLIFEHNRWSGRLMWSRRAEQ